MANDTSGQKGGESTPALARRPATKIETFRIQLASEQGDYYRKIVNYFGGDDDRARKFMSAVVFSVQKNPKLLDVDRESLMSAAMACAEFELYPSNVAGEAFIIPYKGKAQFQLGYQGLITLLFRNGITINSEIVREHDEFDYEAGLTPRLVHKPNAFASEEERGQPVGVYAIATLADGRTYHKVMSAAEVLGFKRFSQSAGSEYSPWDQKNDPLLGMWKKTCIKQLCKLIPKTEQVMKAIAEDDEESTIAERRNALDAGGIAVPKASHRPVLPAAKNENLAGTTPPRPPADNDDGAARCEKHPDSKLDGDGECPKCVAAALEAESRGQGTPLPDIT